MRSDEPPKAGRPQAIKYKGQIVAGRANHGTLIREDITLFHSFQQLSLLRHGSLKDYFFKLTRLPSRALNLEVRTEIQKHFQLCWAVGKARAADIPGLLP